MERRDYMMLIGVMLIGAVAGAVLGGVVAIASGFSFATVFGGVAGSYLGMVYADWHWGPKSRKVRQKRAEEERRRAADAERVARRSAAGGLGQEARPGQTRRAARKASARARR